MLTYADVWVVVLDDIDRMVAGGGGGASAAGAFTSLTLLAQQCKY
jgi:hypothetical protein